ncbi:Uncharacterised protein [Streptococcus criceti]|uniref:Lipoprotein n=1 Tax=Streptococcus criceti HS-6 TaxID=873449 RepID=G5JPY2_STRCG|nr:hypothetical protein [Streptococcus criceti]EHI73300.1 putative lipoprotein [Streptococcus criceti HS-6]SUN43175.1 Uncharacterised protein [Streptococcus criceti]
MKKLLVTLLFISTLFFFVGCSLWTNDTSIEIKSELQNDLSKEDLKDLKIQQLVELKTGDTFELKQPFTG